ncbi:MAG: WecB/TagA/CpsF family glycosyltransferase [Xenococcaceae cyanobacterium]
MKLYTSELPVRYLLNIPIGSIPFEEQISLILQWARLRESRTVCLANVHMLMEAHGNDKFASILRKADLVSPDGMPLVWMLKLMGVDRQDRVAGMDVFLRLCQLTPQIGVSLFFLGSENEVLKRIKAKVKLEFPKLDIAGMESLPFRPLTLSEDELLVRRINESGAGVVLVCLGCPKQEMWIARHRNQIKAVMIGVGAVFPVYAGIYTRAPRYIREWGFEWLYRLMQEPKRLWHRYLLTIPPFLYLSLRQLFQQYFLKKNATYNPNLVNNSKNNTNTNIKTSFEDYKPVASDESKNSI